MPSKKRSSQHVVTPPLAVGGSTSTTNTTRRSSPAKIQRQVMTTEVLGFGSVSEETRIMEIQDPLEEKGRLFWKSSLDRGAGNHLLGKWNHCETDWAFYPLSHGRAREVKKSGVRGVHYAAGYRELGQMVEDHGADVSTWPSLADTNTSNSTENDGNNISPNRVVVEEELFVIEIHSEEEDDQSTNTEDMSVGHPDTANSDSDEGNDTNEIISSAAAASIVRNAEYDRNSYSLVSQESISLASKYWSNHLSHSGWRTFHPKIENVGFIPAQYLDEDTRPKDVRKRGRRGVHYAEGYVDLYEMICKYGMFDFPLDDNGHPIMTEYKGPDLPSPPQMESAQSDKTRSAETESATNSTSLTSNVRSNNNYQLDKQMPSDAVIGRKTSNVSKASSNLPSDSNANTIIPVAVGNPPELNASASSNMEESSSASRSLTSAANNESSSHQESYNFTNHGTHDETNLNLLANLRGETSSSNSSAANIASVSPPTANPPDQVGALARIERLEEMLQLEKKKSLSRKERLSLCEIDVLGHAQNGPLKIRIASLEKEM